MKTSLLTIPCFATVCLLALADRAAAVDAPASSVSASAKKIDWAKMNAGERKEYMKATVLPEMKKLFVSVDANKYAGMSCGTCHGAKSAAEGRFKMPNPELLKLPPPMERAGFMTLHQQKPEMTKFMGSTVKPTMARLLGVDEWSTTNTKGFGCYACHTRQSDAPSGLTQAKVVEPKAPESKPAPAPTPAPMPTPVVAKPAPTPAPQPVAAKPAEAKTKELKPAAPADKAKVGKGKAAKTKTAKAKTAKDKTKGRKGKGKKS